MLRAAVNADSKSRTLYGEGLDLSASRANRTAAMIEAATTRVEANRSCLQRSVFFARNGSPHLA
jgi:hypothetical protein